MSCAARAVPAGALVGWRTPARTGGERLVFPAHSRCRSARRSGNSTRVRTSFLAHRRGVATASLDAGAGVGATREGSQRSFSNCATTSSSRDVAARAVTDPQGVRGAEDDPSEGGDEDASENEGRRDEPRRPGRRATSASPQRRRSARSNAEYRARAVMYGRERDRRNAPGPGTSEAGRARPRETYLPTSSVVAPPPRRADPAATVGARVRDPETTRTMSRFRPPSPRLARSSAASRARWREGTWRRASPSSRRVPRGPARHSAASAARSRRTTGDFSVRARRASRRVRT